MPEKPPLKVAFIVDAWFPFVGGGQVYASELKLRLSEKYNCSVSVFAPSYSNLLYRLLWSSCIWIYIVLKHVFSNYDLFHSQGYNSGFVGKICSILTQTPVIHTVHGSNLMDLDSTGLKPLLERWFLTQICYDAQITVTTKFLDYPNKTTNIVYIPNGVDTKLFDQIPQVKTDYPSLIWVGRDDPVKDVPTLRQVVKRVHEKVPDMKPDIILNGQLTKQQLCKRYKKSWVYLQTSKSEGFSLSILEAMAAGLPVVATNVGQNSLLITNNVNGYLVAPGDVDAMAQKVTTLLRSPALRKSLGQAGQQLVKTRYTWDKVAHQTYQLYTEVLGQKRKE